MLGRNPTPAVGHRRVAAHQRLCERGLKKPAFFFFLFGGLQETEHYKSLHVWFSESPAERVRMARGGYRFNLQLEG